MKTMEEFYWKTLEKDELTDSLSAKKFEQALILLDQDSTQANQQIQVSNELKQLFGFDQPLYLNIIAGESSGEDTESIQQDEDLGSTSEEEVYTETFRMDTQTPKKENGKECQEQKTRQVAKSEKVIFIHHQVSLKSTKIFMDLILYI